MLINGKKLANELLADLKQKAATLPVKPALAVIQVGDDPSSTAYINQKKKRGEEVGIQVIYKHSPETITQAELLTTIQLLNTNSQIRGIIIQRPLPKHIAMQIINESVAREKDVDGFRPDSPFTPPVALAVLHILKILLHVTRYTLHESLLSKNIVILGRGETAGKPIARTFEKMKIPFSVIHRQTTNRTELLKNADIIVSCVGKERVVKKEDIKPGIILIGVGIHRVVAPSHGTNSLMGDYDEEEIKDVARFYTPTPGGVGPLTVAFLLDNLLGAARKKHN